MALFKLNLRPPEKELRTFAGIWFPAFCGMVGLFALRHHAAHAALLIWTVAGALAIAGLIHPAVIRPAYVGLLCLTYPIGLVLSKAMMVIAYFAIISPIGAFMRLFHDPMRRKFDPSAKSYWLPWEPSDTDSYFRQM